MRIGIIGGGSIGLLLAALLVKQKHEVHMFTKSSEQANVLNEEGIFYEYMDGSKYNYFVTASSLDEGISSYFDIIFVTVKSYHLSSLKLTKQMLKQMDTICFVQNGLTHFEFAKEIQGTNVFIMTVEHGAIRSNLNYVLHRGQGEIKFAPVNNEFVLKATDLAMKLGVLIEVENDAWAVLLRKVVLNACINLITATINVKNGELLTNKYAFSLMSEIYVEISEAFLEVQRLVTFEDVKSLCEKTKNNFSSMLQDIQQNRITEVDAIAGELIRQAERRNKDLPTLRVLNSIIKSLEEKGRV